MWWKVYSLFNQTWSREFIVYTKLSVPFGFFSHSLPGSTTPTCCSSTGRGAGASSSWTQRRASPSPRRNSGWSPSWPAFPRCSIASTSSARSWETTLSSKQSRSEGGRGGREGKRGPQGVKRQGGKEEKKLGWGGEESEWKKKKSSGGDVSIFFRLRFFFLFLFYRFKAGELFMPAGLSSLLSPSSFTLSFALLQPEKWRGRVSITPPAPHPPTPLITHSDCIAFKCLLFFDTPLSRSVCCSSKVAKVTNPNLTEMIPLFVL